MQAEKPVTVLPTICRSFDRVTQCVRAWKSAGDRIAVVPTMGALHQGHLSLVRSACENADRVIVTIFVNPIQFGVVEDLERYPRTLDEDLNLLAPLGVDLVFAPDQAGVYPADFGTYIDPPPVARRLEGEMRPGHFRGVTTVVLKLLNMTQADDAWFGQKDFQQVAVVRQMVRDLNMPCEIQVAPTVRDADGLALSSRNRRLSPDERERALAINQSLRAAADSIREGERDSHAIMTGLNQSLIDGGVSEIEYAVIAHPDTLETMQRMTFPAVLLVAAKVGATRLIDNCLVE